MCQCSILRSVASARMANHRVEWVGDFADAGVGIFIRRSSILISINVTGLVNRIRVLFLQ